MNDQDLGTVLRVIHQDRTTLPDPGELHARVRAIPATRRQGRRWLPSALTGSTRSTVGAPRFAVVAVLVALFGGFLVVTQPSEPVAVTGPGAATDEPALPPATGPAGNGLIAYAHDGDVFVGDPVSGETTAVVTGTEADSSPIFSPDGTRIAFLRGDPWTEQASIVVVAADGSDERVAMPAGYSQRGTAFTWTPDGTALLANVDVAPRDTPYFDGELSLLDPSGIAEPRLITPPLPRGPGGPYFRYSDHVAPMFRPPDGGMILTTTGETLVTWDRDLEQRTTLAPRGLDAFEPDRPSPWALSWSPDGSMIAFVLQWGAAYQFEAVFVMGADGSDARRLDGGGTTWSPDGSTLAGERCTTHPDGRVGGVIVVADVAAGSERVLEATRVATKQEGEALEPADPTDEPLCGWYSGPEGRAWDYEGWSWSPDGRSIVLLERRGTRPLVVDVETGEATELPWQSDSAPSWQRVATG